MMIVEVTKMSIENENQANRLAELQPHLQNGSEWSQGDSQHMETAVTYEVENPKDRLAEVIHQLRLLERTRWPKGEYVLLVTGHTEAGYTIQPTRRKK